MDLDQSALEAAINLTYPGLQLFARDANPGALAAKYVPGQIIREPGFTDASCRVGGMVTSHRFAILSNHMVDISEFEHGTNWGLCIANRGAYFKVLDVFAYSGRTQIALLHLPGAVWQLFEHVSTNIDTEIIAMARSRFEVKCSLPPIPELATAAWLDRCSMPLGLDDAGNYFPLHDSPAGSTSNSPDKSPAEPSSDIQAIIDSFTWTFAKTMPDKPHWYIVKKHVDRNDYEKLFRFIFDHHIIEWFEGAPYKTVRLGEYKYWIMDDEIDKSYIINRALISPHPDAA